ncbi:SAM-dependent methyltransferase [Micromonosporaceae bacterium Da 78-11]
MTVRSESGDVLPEVDPQRPNPARIYDYFLGGTHHFAADREAAAGMLAVMPQLPAISRVSRDFLRRAVITAAAAGIDQFLDLGSGIPTAGNVHEVARRSRPDAHVVYVDLEAVAVVHGRRVLAGDPGADVVLADLTEPDVVLAAPAVRRLLDLSRPVCLLAVGVAHFIPDTERLGRALEQYREVLAPGSWLVVTHACAGVDRQRAETTRRIYTSTTSAFVLRDAEEVRPFFGDWPLLEPGLTTGNRWRPDAQADHPDVDDRVADSVLVGVARKP